MKITDIFIIRFNILINILIGILCVFTLSNQSLVHTLVIISICMMMISFLLTFINNKIIQILLIVLLFISGVVTRPWGYLSIVSAGVLFFKLKNQKSFPMKQLIILLIIVWIYLIFSYVRGFITIKSSDKQVYDLIQNVYNSISEKDRKNITFEEVQSLTMIAAQCRNKAGVQRSNNSLTTQNAYASCVKDEILRSNVSLDKATIILKAIATYVPKK